VQFPLLPIYGTPEYHQCNRIEKYPQVNVKSSVNEIWNMHLVVLVNVYLAIFLVSYNDYKSQKVAKNNVYLSQFKSNVKILFIVLR
jgi:hypothetical protein